MTSTGTAAGRTSAWGAGDPRPDLSDIENFWTAPITERAAAFAALRVREPVPFYPEPQFSVLPRGAGFWALTRLDDLVEASRNPRIFVSGEGATTIPDMPAEFREFYGSMISMDDPRHARLRRIVSRGFTPKRLAALTEDVERTARTIVDDVIDAGECDAVTEISSRLPLKIVCDMMGVPQSQYSYVFDRSNVILGAGDPEYVPDVDNILVALLQAGNDLAELMRDLGRPPHRPPHGRRHVRAGQRRDRRRAAHPGRAGQLLHPARGGGQRDHPQRDQLGPAPAHRAPGAARRVAGRPRRRHADGGRGDRAVGVAGDLHAAHPGRGRRARRAADDRGRQGAAVLLGGQPRSRALRATRTASTSAAPPTRTSGSAGPGRTSAWARTWPAGRSR